MTPKVDTFEHNIVEEIKRKDASLTQISAASNDVGNIPTDTVKKNPIIIMIAGSIFIVCLIGGAALAYYYYTDSLLPPSAAPVKVSPSDVPKKTALLATISPTLDVEIGRVVTKVEKKNEGYILTINDYSAVFGYMTRNESEYIEELALLFSLSGSAQARATSTPIIASSTPKIVLPPITASTSPIVTSSSTASSTSPKVNISATTTATSSQKTAPKVTPKPTTKKPLKQATSTSPAATSTPTPPPAVPIPVAAVLQEAPTSSFSDVTISNQNMRVWKSGSRVVVYAFVGTNTVLISNSTEGILSLKGAILR